jgi:hypothetical protein
VSSWLQPGTHPSSLTLKECNLPNLAAPLQLNGHLYVRVFVKEKIQTFCCYTEGLLEFVCLHKLKTVANRARYSGSVINRRAAGALVLVRATR